MFSVNLKNKRVVIEHTVQASDGKVDLHTTFDLQDVPGERVLLWAAANRLSQWLPASEIIRLKSAEVKKRFDNLVVDCKDPLHSRGQTGSRQEAIIDDLRSLVKEGASIEKLVQSVIRNTHKIDR